MQLQIKPHTHNTFPIGGLLIQSAEVRQWILEIQRMELEWQKIKVYPIPDTSPNHLWGCLLVLPVGKKIKMMALHEYCQLVADCLFIPENSLISPYLSPEEITKLFHNNYHIFHPEFGLVELSEPVDWLQVLEGPQFLDIEIKTPQAPVFIPTTIKSFQVQAVEPKEILEDLENQFQVEQNRLEDQPLSFFEKGKLAFYQEFFKNDDTNNPKEEDTKSANWFEKIFGKSEDWIEGMRTDYENLEKRNQKQLDKLMDMLQKDPNEALKYAIPLDEGGLNRGGISSDASFKLSKRWNNFSLFPESTSSSGRGSINLGDQFYTLQEQYRKTAKALLEKGEHRKAAFVYLKLLKDYWQAADVLKQGKYYEDAASVYLKYLKDKKRAAECYEKGFFTEKAIELYETLKMYEKVGDLYVHLGQIETSHTYYELVVAHHKSKDQYLKASLIYRNKMKMPQKGQDTLLEGWEKNQDAFNCLNNYLNNITDEEKLGEEIDRVYQQIEPHQKHTFLKVLHYEFKKQHSLAENIRDIAYDLVSIELKNKPEMASELLKFNINNQELAKDTIRFRNKKK